MWYFPFLEMKKYFPRAYESFINSGNFVYNGDELMLRVLINGASTIAINFQHRMIYDFFDQHQIMIGISASQAFVPSITYQEDMYISYQHQVIVVKDEATLEQREVERPMGWFKKDDSRKPVFYPNRINAEFAATEFAFKLLEDKLSVNSVEESIIDSLGNLEGLSEEDLLGDLSEN